MKNDDDKLLQVLNDDQFANAPLRDVVKHLYFQVIQSQVLETKLRAELSETNKRLAIVQDALWVPGGSRGTPWNSIKYGFQGHSLE